MDLISLTEMSKYSFILMSYILILLYWKRYLILSVILVVIHKKIHYENKSTKSFMKFVKEYRQLTNNSF